MDLIRNPCRPREMVFHYKDSVKFVKLTFDKPKNDALCGNDYILTDAALPLPKNDLNNISCMAWCSGNHCESAITKTVAVGFTSGEVVMTWPDTDRGAETNASYIKIYQSTKPCTALAWCRAQPNLLAVGTEGIRSDHSLIVLDRVADVAPSGAGDISRKLWTKSQYETCFAETINSLTWSRTESKTLLAGVNAKYLRKYDLRNIRSLSSSVNTQAVYGIQQDPCSETRFSSFSENQINIWDLRNFSKPAAVISVKYNPVKAVWCPTRRGFLATVSNGPADDTQKITVYDLNHTMVTDSDPDIAYRHVEQIINLKLNAEENVSSFTWMEDTTNQLVAITNTRTLHCINVPERISLCWTKANGLLSASKKLHWCDRFKSHLSLEKTGPLNDIGHIMYQRALNGYGLNEDVANHDPKVNLENENKSLSVFWKWIKSVRMSSAKEPSQGSKNYLISARSVNSSKEKKPNKFSGMLNELSSDVSSTSESIDWVGVSGVKCTVYSSPQRSTALKMCGWCPIKECRSNESDFKNGLLDCTDFERAAAVALWHLDMRSAIDILQKSIKPGNDKSKAGSQEYSIVAMALSGYPGNGASSLWRELCSNLQKSMPSPYLRAAFAFLNVLGNGIGTHNDILKDNGISYSDRVGFACMYLPDDRLTDVLETLCDSAAESGDLEGVIATGLTTDRGIQLMQSYVDKTKDVQTAALALIQTGYSEILKNRSAMHMINGYKNLLNGWTLWKERVLVDIAIGEMSVKSTMRSSNGISAQCNYCNKSIKHDYSRMPFMVRGRSALHGMKSKSTSCPSCRKPLPRCSVCSMYLGTSSIDTNVKIENTNAMDNDLEFWFTWCMACQHGGHTGHLRAWFNEHTECPLSGCTCKCRGMDKY